MCVICPDCQTRNDADNIVCKECSCALKKEEILSPLNNLTSFLPNDTPGIGKTGEYSKETFVNVTAGTELWRKIGWKGVFIFLSILFVLLLVMFILSWIIF
jgi:hypothetical protein